MLDFKDFMTVEYMPGYDSLINYRAIKRKRGVLGESEMSISARRKAGIRMKRLSKKISRIRKRKLKRTANKEVINQRSQRQARADMFRKFSKGKNKEDIPLAQRKSIEKKVNRLANVVKRKAVRGRAATRKLDRSRK